jgi:hypothetical protein
VTARWLWAEIADVAVGGGMAAYRALDGRRSGLLPGRGAEAGDERGALSREVAALTAGLEISEADRPARLDTIAEPAARVVPLEQAACAALAGSGAVTS